MKKFGFTLIEILIALTVVGVLAAILVPQIANLIPDENKLRVLRTQKMLTEINRELLNDKGIYYETYDDNDNKPTCQGFACLRKPLKEPYNDNKYSDNKKFVNILADKLDYDAFQDSSLEGEEGDYFYTKDGAYWKISKSDITINDGVDNIEIGLLVDFGGTVAGVNCLYDQDSCPNPDRFEFTIDTYGKITGSDSLTKAYLENPDKTNDRSVDFARAKEISESK